LRAGGAQEKEVSELQAAIIATLWRGSGGTCPWRRREAALDGTVTFNDPASMTKPSCR